MQLLYRYVAVSCGPMVKIVDVANGQFNELKTDKLEFDTKCEVRLDRVGDQFPLTLVWFAVKTHSN
jgi:hypothetical protein